MKKKIGNIHYKVFHAKNELDARQTEAYQEMANSQHFASMKVSAHRGSIYDAKGVALAKSATVYTVFVG